MCLGNHRPIEKAQSMDIGSPGVQRKESLDHILSTEAPARGGSDLRTYLQYLPSRGAAHLRQGLTHSSSRAASFLHMSHFDTRAFQVIPQCRGRPHSKGQQEEHHLSGRVGRFLRSLGEKSASPPGTSHMQVESKWWKPPLTFVTESHLPSVHALSFFHVGRRATPSYKKV